MSKKRDFYEILGVSKNADADELKKEDCRRKSQMVKRGRNPNHCPVDRRGSEEQLAGF